MTLRLKRSILGPFLVALALAAMALLTAAPFARGELIGEFNARLKGIKLSYGAYTAVFESRIYETSGAPPPSLEKAQIRFPRGASIRSQFLKKKFYCNTVRLEQRADPAVCKASLFATGDILLDARPHIADAIPTDLFLFLAKPRQPGAIATVAVLVVSNKRTPVYASQVLFGGLFPDSGKFGYRLDLPTKITPLIPGLRLSLAELNLTVTGLTLAKKVKRKTRRGKKTKLRKVFWTRVPRCTGKRRVTFAVDYQFDNAAPISKQKTIACKRFIKRPSTDGKGGIPGA